MRVLMSGAAALALAAGGAYAQSENSANNPGNDNDRGRSTAPIKGNDERNERRADRDRGPQSPVQRADAPGNGKIKVDRDDDRRRDDDRGSEQARQAARDNVNDHRKGDGRRIVERRINRDDRSNSRAAAENRNDRRIERAVRDTRWLVQDRNRGLVGGCPPGLARKRNGCNPPGQVRGRYQRSLYGYDYSPSIFGLRNYDRRGDYSYNDGYLVRYDDGGGIASWLPLLGGALGIGNVWPSGYQSYAVPDYYVDYYDLGGPDRYRYADNVIYRVDPENEAITSIAALITGDEFTIGQRMPAGYDVYNVPYAFRDRYYDTPQYMYRYSDGYIYQIDPETRLVAAAIDMLI